MIHCLAIDDEPLALEQLKTYIEKTEGLTLAAAVESVAEARKCLENERVDAIFTDIQMPDVSGMDFIRSLDTPPIVVFTTAYSQYAVEGFKVNALDYLLKPFGLDDFERTAEKVRRQYALLHPAVTPETTTADDGAIFLKTDYKTIRVETDNIRYVEGMSEYLRFHFRDDHKPVTALLSMKRLENYLPAKQFMRVHRSYLINLACIREYNRQRITLEGGEIIPVGDIYKNTFLAYLEGKFLYG
ncbi:MAG: LytR/AlgR family response regulator transcription factor [Alloprevotella sp.]